MPFNNLGAKHATQSQIDRFDDAVNALATIIAELTGDGLSQEERQQFGSINEKNKGFANSIQDFATTQPDLRSPQVDWAEFEADYNDRKFADTRESKVNRVLRLLTDFKIVHDYDNYRAGLVDYDYTKYRADAGDSAFLEKYEKLKQFFEKNPGGGGETPPL